MIKVIELINVICSIKIKSCIDDKNVKDDKDDKYDNDVDKDNDDNDGEYNDVNEHLENLIVTKQIDQKKSMITNLNFEALFAHWDKGRTNFSGEIQASRTLT